MKHLLLLLFSIFVLHGYAQLSEKNKRKIDSLYPVALDISNSVERRCKAYKSCCWLSVYQDYNKGVKYSSEYFALANANNLHDHITIGLHFNGYSQMMLGNFELANKSYQKGLQVAIQNNNIKQISKLYADRKFEIYNR